MIQQRLYLSCSLRICRSPLFQVKLLLIKSRALCIALLFNLFLLALCDHALANKTLAVLPPRTLAANMTMSVANGVVLSRELLRTSVGSEQVSLLDSDLASGSMCLGVVQAHDRLISPDETVSSMANRTAALGGINGDYFEIHGSGRPISMVMRNNLLLQSPTYNPVLGINAAGLSTISIPSYSSRVIAGGVSHVLNSVNIYRDAIKGNLVFITPVLGAAISVKNDTVAVLQPVANTPEVFTVQSVKTNGTNLASNHYALVAGGNAGKWLASNLHIGTRLTLDEHIFPDNSLVQAIGGGPQIVKNGTLYYSPNLPNPRTMTTRDPLTVAAINKDGTHVLLAVFDGRFADSQQSTGLTPVEAAKYMIAHGAYQAMLFDGGGSSELVARLPGQHQVSVINSPSDGRERPVANGFFMYKVDGSNHPACERKSVA